MKSKITKYSIVFLDVSGSMKRIKKKRNTQLSIQPALHQNNTTSKDITQCKKYEVIKKNEALFNITLTS